MILDLTPKFMPFSYTTVPRSGKDNTGKVYWYHAVVSLVLNQVRSVGSHLIFLSKGIIKSAMHFREIIHELQDALKRGRLCQRAVRGHLNSPSPCFLKCVFWNMSD